MTDPTENPDEEDHQAMPRPAARKPAAPPAAIKPTLPWVRIETVTLEEPNAIDYSKLPKGRRARNPPQIVVADKIDSAGRHWRQYDHDPPVLMDTIDDLNAERA